MEPGQGVWQGFKFCGEESYIPNIEQPFVLVLFYNSACLTVSLSLIKMSQQCNQSQSLYSEIWETMQKCNSVQHLKTLEYDNNLQNICEQVFLFISSISVGNVFSSSCKHRNTEHDQQSLDKSDNYGSSADLSTRYILLQLELVLLLTR